MVYLHLKARGTVQEGGQGHCTGGRPGALHRREARVVHRREVRVVHRREDGEASPCASPSP